MGTRSKGSEGEELAATFLLRKGYRILERNYRFERAEIDLIARDGDELVFVEVKSRYSDRFGSPEESVTPSKVEQLRKAADGYFHEHQISHQLCRFDVVAIRFVKGRPQIRLIQNAFV